MSNRKGRSRKSGPRTPSGQLSRAGKVEKDTKGTLALRMRHARPLLSLNDQNRLHMLVTMSPQSLLDEGVIELRKGNKSSDPVDILRRATIRIGMEREALFTKAARAPNAEERKDPIGRAWHEGLLDGHDADPKTLRNIGRELGYLYWHEYAAADATIGGYTEMLGKGSVAHSSKDPATIKDRAGQRWKAFSAIIDPLGPQVRIALHKLCVDDIWSLEGPAWLDRLIATVRIVNSLQKGDTVTYPAPGAGELARKGDTETLRLAISALVALARGTTGKPPALLDARSVAMREAVDMIEVQPRPLPPVNPAFLDEAGHMRPWPEIAQIITGSVGSTAAPLPSEQAE